MEKLTPKRKFWQFTLNAKNSLKSHLRLCIFKHTCYGAFASASNAAVVLVTDCNVSFECFELIVNATDTSKQKHKVTIWLQKTQDTQLSNIKC